MPRHRPPPGDRVGGSGAGTGSGAAGEFTAETVSALKIGLKRSGGWVLADRRQFPRPLGRGGRAGIHMCAARLRRRSPNWSGPPLTCGRPDQEHFQTVKNGTGLNRWQVASVGIRQFHVPEHPCPIQHTRCDSHSRMPTVGREGTSLESGHRLDPGGVYWC